MASSFLIIGAGFSGSVLARELVSLFDCQVEIWEARNHLAGNCFTSTDEQTGIMVHHYGPHIFNTEDKEIWDYFNQYAELRHYVHRVKAVHRGQVYSLPINLSTLNQFFNKIFTPESAQKFLESIGGQFEGTPNNFEEQAIRFVGQELYQAFFYGYTKKQWGCEPRELPASILKRLPVRFDYDDNYHLHYYTGIPERGYTEFVRNLLDHPRIKVRMNRKFHSAEIKVHEFDHVFFTGPIDAYFNHEFGRLGYRTLDFEKEIRNGDFQGCAQINYCDEKTPYTRITEHKYFTPWKKFDQTIIFREYSREAMEGDTLYYPKRLAKDKEMVAKYYREAESLSRISFLGRLGTYRYLDMQHVIKEAIDFARGFHAAKMAEVKPPVFPEKIGDITQA